MSVVTLSVAQFTDRIQTGGMSGVTLSAAQLTARIQTGGMSGVTLSAAQFTARIQTGGMLGVTLSVRRRVCSVKCTFGPSIRDPYCEALVGNSPEASLECQLSL